MEEGGEEMGEGGGGGQEERNRRVKSACLLFLSEARMNKDERSRPETFKL